MPFFLFTLGERLKKENKKIENNSFGWVGVKGVKGDFFTRGLVGIQRLYYSPKVHFSFLNLSLLTIFFIQGRNSVTRAYTPGSSGKAYN